VADEEEQYESEVMEPPLPSQDGPGQVPNMLAPYPQPKTVVINGRKLVVLGGDDESASDRTNSSGRRKQKVSERRQPNPIVQPGIEIIVEEEETEEEEELEEVKEDKKDMHQAPLLMNKDQQLVKPQL
jgi:hypothetical protein